MATTRQRRATKNTIKKARPEGRGRKSPGARGGKYYRVEVRPKSEFVSFRTQDVGRKGHIQRVAGKRASGSWATVTWLIGKEDAHIQNGRLVADSEDVRKLIAQLGSKPVHQQGDRFKAKDRRNIPERSKPTAAQRRARSGNIKKAQAVRQRSGRSSQR